MNSAIVNNMRSRTLAFGAALVGLLTVVGCGSKEAFQVSGRAQYEDGSPIKGAVRIIRFEPTSDSTATIRKAAAGTIAEDGSFELFTRKPGDGVYPGKYAVTFSILTQAMGGTSLVPTYYTHSKTTPFDIVVDDDKEDLLFELEKL